MLFVCPHLIDVKNITQSLSNKALETFQSSSVLLLKLDQHRNIPVGFFSLSFNIDSFDPHLFPHLVDTFPSHTKIFSFETSINDDLSVPNLL